MGTLKIAFKNFLRTKRKSRNLTIVIIASFFLVLVMLCFFSTMKENYWNFWIEKFIGGNTIVRDTIDGFDIFSPVKPDYYFSESAYLSLNSNASSVSPRLRIGAIIEGADDTVPIIVIGIDIEKEKRIGNHINIIRGDYISNYESGILMPEELAYKLGIKLNTEIVLSVLTKDGYANYDLVPVKGILEPIRALDLTMGSSIICYMPINIVRELIYTDTDDVSEFLAAGSTTNIKGYKLIDGNSSFSVVRVLSIMLRILRIVFLVFIIIFVFNIVFQSVLLAVSEREMEFALFMAYGSKNSYLFWLIFFEYLFYSIYCCLFGFAASFMFLKTFNMLQLTPFGAASQILMATSGKFAIALSPLNIINSFVIITLLVFAGSMFPVFSCLKNIRIVEIFSKSKR